MSQTSLASHGSQWAAVTLLEGDDELFGGPFDGCVVDSSPHVVGMIHYDPATNLEGIAPYTLDGLRAEDTTVAWNDHDTVTVSDARRRHAMYVRCEGRLRFLRPTRMSP